MSSGDGTIYSSTCPHMSYYLVGALTTLAFATLHTGSMVVALDGLCERRDLKHGLLLPSGAHLAAALLVGGWGLHLLTRAGYAYPQIMSADGRRGGTAGDCCGASS